MKLFGLALPILLFGTGCGYRLATAADSGSRFSVTAAPLKTPHFEALQAILSGVRSGLSEAGSLGTGTAFPRVVVEVLRVDEVATAIAATPEGDRELPMARASAVGVIARAWVIEGPDRPPASETGDVRRVEYVAQGSEPMQSGFAYSSAVKAAGRRVGEALARRILGEAEPATDPM